MTTKNLTKREKSVPLPISKFIDTKFRDYAVYVLEARGIPSFVDALTPVQRYILKSSPTAYQKTLSVVGKAISQGYHHGNCLSYDTSINLADGTSITIGEWFDKYPEATLLVVSKDENDEQTVGVAHSPRIGQTTNEFYEIELENGEIIKCTANHPFFVDGKWTIAEDISEGSKLFGFSGHDKKMTSTVKSIRKITFDEPVNFYDITVENHHNFSIGSSKIIVHNSSL